METKSVAVLVEKLVGYLEKTEGLVTDHAPDVIAQYLNYEIVTTIGLFVFTLALAVTFAIIMKYLFRIVREEKAKNMHVDTESWNYGIALCAMFGFVDFMFVICKGLYLIKLFIAPKVVILDYLKTLI